MKQDMIAMILAGGQGTRLGVLTKQTAKPAVPFGGKYRIIDFALSNCANSGIKNIGVVTQYQPLELNEHIGKGAAWGLTSRSGGATILQPRFGIMNTDQNGRIIEFEEKPAQPKSNLASMGIYIFNWETLRRYLVEDQAKNREMEDFGKNVIPAYLSNAENCFAYSFEGYWKDVGTIESLWEANMEFLDPEHPLNISEDTWRIYTSNPVTPPQFLTEDAQIKHSLVVDGCYIAGQVDNSLMSRDVKVGPNSQVDHSVVMSSATIGKGCRVEYAIIGEQAVIADGASVIGTPDQIATVGYAEVVGGPKNDGEE